MNTSNTKKSNKESLTTKNISQKGPRKDESKLKFHV